jgi:AraC family transcriptional regulator, melibiose operon regulatory protein
VRRFIGSLNTSNQRTLSKSLILREGDVSNVEKMTRFIAENYTKPLKVDEIAKSVHLHPNYAMRLFRKTIGKTIMNYIIEHRLSHAQKLLITSDDLRLDIALKSGFGTLSRFNIAFKKIFKCTPGYYRKNYKINPKHLTAKNL